MEDTKNLQTDKKNKDYKININKSLQHLSCYNNSNGMCKWNTWKKAHN